MSDTQQADSVLSATIETDPSHALGPTQRPVPVFPDPAPLDGHGPARIVAVCNQMGWGSKTTTTINLGAALAEQGRRILLVDFDPQGALSVGLGKGDPRQLELTVHNLLLERNVEWDDVVLDTGREYILGQVLKPAVPYYDFILIDCQPSLGLLTINALAAADGVLVPMECEYFAMRGVALLMETIEKVQSRINPELAIDGFLGTMYDSRTLHTREVLGRIVDAFGPKVFHTVINRTVRFPDATVVGEPITVFDSASMGANAYRELAKEVIETWRTAA